MHTFLKVYFHIYHNEIRDGIVCFCVESYDCLYHLQSRCLMKRKQKMKKKTMKKEKKRRRKRKRRKSSSRKRSSREKSRRRWRRKEILKTHVPLFDDLYSHLSHWNGFSPVCIRMWRFRSELILNLAGHLVQWKGESPVWVRRWTISWLEFRLAYEQIWHLQQNVCHRFLCLLS